MLYLCDSFFIFSLIFIVADHTTSLKLTHFFRIFMDDDVDEESKQFSKIKSAASGCCLVFATFFTNFSMALLIKLLIIGKACIKVL